MSARSLSTLVILWFAACRGPAFQADGGGAGASPGGGPQGGGGQGAGAAGAGGEGASGGGDPCLSCVAGDNATASCDAGACVITCEPGFGDCDDDASDCETDVTVNGQCGACGVTCGYGECIAVVDGHACNDPVDVEAGDDFTCALKRNGTVWCWGSNALGQLGRMTPTNLGPLPGPVAALKGFFATELQLGKDYGCMRDGNGELSCWPDVANSTGRAIGVVGPGVDEILAMRLGSRGFAALAMTADGVSRFMFDSTSMTTLSFESDYADTIDFDVSGSNPNACLVRANGELRCRGPNSFGQVGGSVGVDPIYTPLVIEAGVAAAAVGLGQEHLCARTDDGAVHCRGRSGTGQVDNMNVGFAQPFFAEVAPANVDRLVVGPRHNALWIGGVLHLFGENSRNQCSPTGMDTSFPAARTFDEGTVVDAALGLEHTCALFENGRVQCWGRGGFGQLGDGGLSDSADPIDVAL